MHLAMPWSSLRSRPRRGQRAGRRGRVDRADEPPIPHGRHRRIIRTAPIVRVPCRPARLATARVQWPGHLRPPRCRPDPPALCGPSPASDSFPRKSVPKSGCNRRILSNSGRWLNLRSNHAHNDVGDLRPSSGAAEWAFVAPLPVSSGGDTAGDLPAPAPGSAKGLAAGIRSTSRDGQSASCFKLRSGSMLSVFSRDSMASEIETRRRVGRRARRGGPRRIGRHPHLELLETRITPSTWTGAGGTPIG